MSQPNANEGRQQRFWDTLPAEAQDAFLAVGQPINAKIYDVLALQTDASGDILLIRSGLVKAIARAGQQKVLLSVHGAGALLGVTAYLAGRPTLAAVVAVEPTEAVRIGRAEFGAWLAQFPRIQADFHRAIAVRQLAGDETRIATASLSVSERLARLLLKVMEEPDDGSVDGRRTAVRLSQAELASCIGASLRSVTRSMASWRRRQIVIADERRSVVVRQPDALRRIAGLGR
ncbi:cAMP-binding domain of CRP or a regulatory subunit of cAMP-dependent protein kinases [Asanoa hainanensis]|uniref:cAMP-binding domain of CRP or a regulatory subunit of cAMP-dependent protein kinases n=1 Tax=Asanoa hainanensis TaxID=560556 RepID=A0A239KC99_9ACTN|nr:Crp/Fnr family transcriptional regulator [Asanoa hainanensis]SNT16026.1 cAMP-binding domain of CRP or a regulatory subunit of cAMP-dependent protein kinases [Asanoa hainanensis]